MKVFSESERHVCLGMFDLKGGAGSNLIDLRKEGIMQILNMINIKNPILAHTFGTSRYVYNWKIRVIVIYISMYIVFCLKSHVCTVQSMYIYIYIVFFEIHTTWIKTYFCTFILIFWSGRGILFDRT